MIRRVSDLNVLQKMKSADNLITLIVAYLLTMVVSQVAQAHSPATPYRHVVSNEKFFFVMLPTQYQEKNGEWVESAPPSGTAYRVTNKGKFRKLWSVEGWYAFPGDVLLSADGKTLIRIREQFLQQDGTIFGDDESDALITIWRKGKQVKEYSAKGVISDLKAGIRSDGITGFKWLDRSRLSPVIEPSRLHWIDENTEGETTVCHHPDVFQLVTLEGNLILFDLKTGWILTKKPNDKQEDTTDDSDVDPFADEVPGQKAPESNAKAEQGGAEQPATAPESKPEGEKKPKPESEGRSQ